MPDTRILLIRHAESAPAPDTPEADWPLSDAGVSQSLDLAASLASRGSSRIYSSPFKRAIATVQPLAAALGLSVTVDSDLRERKSVEGWVENRDEILRRSWLDFDFALPGCESARACQDRMRTCLENIAAVNAAATAVACSHGNAIALFLNALDPSFGYEQWRAMKNPHVFDLRRTPDGWSYTP